VILALNDEDLYCPWEELCQFLLDFTPREYPVIRGHCCVKNSRFHARGCFIFVSGQFECHQCHQISVVLFIVLIVINISVQVESFSSKLKVLIC